MIVKGFRRMFTGLHWVAAGMFFVATVLTTVNAITRYAFNYVIFGSEEICTYTVLILSFLMFPIMESEDRHLKVDIFTSSVSNQKLKDTVFIIRGLITMGICGLLTYYGWRVTSTAIKYESTSPTLHIPKDIVFGLTAAAFMLAVLGWLAIIFFNKRRAL
jgi:TRAP-type C4-dicarboxylate transport system permease small subunit